MGRIKSAWEIALERTENIEVDAEKIRHSANIEAIRKIAGAYLLSDEDTEESTREKLLQYGSDDKREALGQTIINALSLPQEEKSDDKKAQRLSFLLSIAVPSGDEIQDFLGQVLAHIAQYPVHREQLMNQLKEQFEPMLREKEEKLRAQYGEAPHLSLENDKEYRKVANQYLERLRDQYQEALDDAKKQLKEALS